MGITVERIKHLWNRVFINKSEDEKIGRKEQYRSRSRAPNLITGLVCLNHFKKEENLLPEEKVIKVEDKKQIEDVEPQDSDSDSASVAEQENAVISFNEDELNSFFSAPLDTAIYLSLVRASIGQPDKIAKFGNNILLTGGGGKLKYLSKFLEEKLSEKIPKVQCKKAPRELDSESIAWQGAAETSKIIDTWVTKQEWDIKREFAINDKAYFVW
eukprot:NODE_245_length_11874_cov_0.539546.p6 type:complete len:214 gc:universal NODE_245_length_11874_cov_0.539546:10251-10892(+)